MPELNNSVSVGLFNHKVGGWGDALNHVVYQQKQQTGNNCVKLEMAGQKLDAKHLNGRREKIKS